MSRSLNIRNVRISDPQSPFHAQICDIRVEAGAITHISASLSEPADEEIDGSGAWVSPGWVDAYSRIPDPGEPWKESLASACEAAQQGGFTHLFALCGTHPSADLPETLESVGQRSRALLCQVHPLGMVSEKGQGKELSELHMLSQAGAVAFTDGIVASPKLSQRLKTMQYAHSLGLSLWSHPCMAGWLGEAKMHEGTVNASLGLKGIPSMAEFVELQADLELVRYTGASLRILGVSCRESVELIRQAKAEGLPIWASVPVMNLAENDTAMSGFDENFKVLPPLRSEDDRLALWEGLQDGTLDAVISNHHPEDAETSLVEFDYSPFGAATLPLVWSLLSRSNPGMDADALVSRLHRGARTFCGLPSLVLAPGAPADLTLFQVSGETAIRLHEHGSTAVNMPYAGQVLPGQVLGTLCNGTWKGGLR